MRRILVFILLFTVTAGHDIRAQGDESRDSSDVRPALEAVLDSLHTEPDTLLHWDLASPPQWPTTDSVWVPASAESLWRESRGRGVSFGGRPLLGYSKVQGVNVGLRLRVQRREGLDLHLGGALRRALASGRWEGFGVVGLFSPGSGSTGLPRGGGARLTGGGSGTPGGPRGFQGGLLRQRGWGIVLGWSRQPVPFTSNRPYGTTLLSLLAGLDHQDYLNRREGVVAFLLQPARELQGELLFIRREDESLAPTAGSLLDLDEEVMGRNISVDRTNANGAVLSWSVGESRDMLIPEVGGSLRFGAWGGVFGGNREFYTFGGEARRFFPVPPRSKIRTEIWLGFSGGNPPVQELGDLGGESSLRGYPPASFTGPAIFLVRGDYLLGIDIFREMRFPVLRRLGLQPAVFFDAGVVWGDRPWDGVDELGFPNTQDWRFDAGVGLQRLVGFPGLISAVRLDVAWRLDRQRDRIRLNLHLIP